MLKKVVSAILILCLSLSFAAVGRAAGEFDTEVADMKTCGQAGPIGIDVNPAFSWRMETARADASQTAYNIKVYDAELGNALVWDSGIVYSAFSQGIKYGGDPLSKGRRYSWTVTVYDENGAETVSDPAYFETGSLNGDVFEGAEWIKVDAKKTLCDKFIDLIAGKGDESRAKLINSLLNYQNSFFLKGIAAYFADKAISAFGSATFRKEFGADSEIASARLYTSGRGVYNVYLNGGRVGDDELKPGYTQVDARAFYNTYDVADMLKSGKNAVSATVSSGWWSDKIVSSRGGDSLFIAVLEIKYENGEIDRVVTDNTWKAANTGPVTAASIYEGEVYDALADLSFRNTGYDDGKWQNAAASDEFKGVITSAAIGAGVKVREDLEQFPEYIEVYSGAAGANVTKYGDVNFILNEYMGGDAVILDPGQTAVVNFGQNFAGREYIELSGEKGAIVRVKHGEMLNEAGGVKSRGNDGPGGSLYTRNLRGVNAASVYRLNGEGVQAFYPEYTFYGFQYMEITATKKITIHSVKGQVLTSVLNDTGSIETSDADINKLISNIFYGQYSNYLSVPTDCPQRDERLGWSADTQVFSTAAMYNADSYAFLRKWMQDMRDNQLENGAYPSIAPYGIFDSHGQLGWADAGIIVPYNLYKIYGDIAIIEENYESMKRFMDVYMASTDKNGGGHAFGDWLAYESNDDDIKRLIGIAYYAWDAMMMTKMAEIIGEDADAARYAGIYDTQKEYFTSQYVNADGTLKRTEQTACLMALYVNLLPSEGSKDIVKATLVENIRRNGNKLQTGFLGTAIILDVLTDIGEYDLAYALLLQHDEPSWLYSVDQGATTIWERWNSYTIEKGFGDPGMNSFNHYAYGSVAAWMYRCMAGINYDIDNPGFKEFALKPVFNKAFEFVNCSFDSPYGKIVSNWAYDGDKLSYEAAIPANTKAAIYIPVCEIADVKVNGVAAGSLPAGGVEYQGIIDGRHVFAAGSGTYAFD